MYTLASFKREHQVEKLEFMKGKGRAFTTVKGKSLIIGSKTDLTKPLFVVELTANKDGVAIDPGTAYVIVNNEKITVLTQVL